MHVAMLESPGIVGARQAGAGFGGCLLAWVDEDEVDRFAAATSERYWRATGRRADVHPILAAEGAGLLASA